MNKLKCMTTRYRIYYVHKVTNECLNNLCIAEYLQVEHWDFKFRFYVLLNSQGHIELSQKHLLITYMSGEILSGLVVSKFGI